MSFYKAKELSFALNKTYVMGILNITPDSFSDGGEYLDHTAALEKALELERDGADILDIGAQSTRPGSEQVSAEAELERILPVLDGLQGKIHIPISVDTFYPLVAEKCLETGAAIINDVSGKIDMHMLDVVKRYQAGYIVMHNEAISTPVAEVLRSLACACVEYGIDPERIMIDPGLGFEKNTDENIQILKTLDRLTGLGFPVLVGASRKRFIGAVCGAENPKDRDIGTLAVSVAAVAAGVNFIRVHEVKNTKQAMCMADRIYRLED